MQTLGQVFAGCGIDLEAARQPTRAVVAVVETHNVVQLGRACLEDDRVLEGCHAVPSTGEEMDCLSGEQLE